MDFKSLLLNFAYLFANFMNFSISLLLRYFLAPQPRSHPSPQLPTKDAATALSARGSRRAPGSHLRARRTPPALFPHFFKFLSFFRPKRHPRGPERPEPEGRLPRPPPRPSSPLPAFGRAATCSGPKTGRRSPDAAGSRASLPLF